MRTLIISAAMAAVVLASAGCTITTRSDNYACTTNEDCEALGRVCVLGWCVADDGQSPDGSLTDAPPAVCPAVCSDCLSDGTCIIQCVNPDDCGNDVVCPPGQPCQVICGNLACDDIDCTAASSCDITCSGVNACSGVVSCGLGSCNVTCSGSVSCSGGVLCADACACETLCTGLGACAGEHTCPLDNECRSGALCSTATAPCSGC
jgi:hypothetical protein